MNFSGPRPSNNIPVGGARAWRFDVARLIRPLHESFEGLLPESSTESPQIALLPTERQQTPEFFHVTLTSQLQARLRRFENHGLLR